MLEKAILLPKSTKPGHTNEIFERVGGYKGYWRENQNCALLGGENQNWALLGGEKKLCTSGRRKFSTVRNYYDKFKKKVNFAIPGFSKNKVNLTIDPLFPHNMTPKVQVCTYRGSFGSWVRWYHSYTADTPLEANTCNSCFCTFALVRPHIRGQGAQL